MEVLAWIPSHPWAWPALEVVHLVGIAMLLGPLVLFELRVWGAGAALEVQPLARFALSLSITGFGLAAASGLTLFLTSPGELLANRAFVVKMALLAVLGANALWFHWRGGVRRLDRPARIQTAMSLGLWLAVIICGRWIAYV
jgi:hypothetical protein